MVVSLAGGAGLQQNPALRRVGVRKGAARPCLLACAGNADEGCNWFGNAFDGLFFFGVQF